MIAEQPVEAQASISNSDVSADRDLSVTASTNEALFDLDPTFAQGSLGLDNASQGLDDAGDIDFDDDNDESDDAAFLEALRTEFASYGVELTGDLSVTTLAVDSEWFLTDASITVDVVGTADTDGETYTIKRGLFPAQAATGYVLAMIRCRSHVDLSLVGSTADLDVATLEITSLITGLFDVTLTDATPGALSVTGTHETHAGIKAGGTVLVGSDPIDLNVQNASVANGETIEAAILNSRGYIDVAFSDFGGSGLKASTLTDLGSEIALTGTAAAGVTLGGGAILVTPNIYRYAFTGSFVDGVVGVEFVAGSFEDFAGNGNVVELESFTVGIIVETIRPTADLTDPTNGCVGCDGRWCRGFGQRHDLSVCLYGHVYRRCSGCDLYSRRV